MTRPRYSSAEEAGEPPPDPDPTSGRRPAAHNPKGIGANVLLTAAAAAVPLVIVGVAGIRTMLGMRKPRR